MAVGGAAALFLLVPPIAQDAAYHGFADSRRVAGIPNGLDVLSNAPFALAGAAGLALLLDRKRSARALSSPDERLPWIVFFLALVGTAFGSTYYHLAPDDARLFWDRLPMAAGFASLLAIVIAERVGPREGRIALAVLGLAAAASLALWRLGGDLRLYGLLQGYAVLFVPLLLIVLPPRYTRGADYVVCLAGYLAAKAAETFDRRIYEALGALSGHTLKHLLAAAAAAWLVRMLAFRRAVAA